MNDWEAMRFLIYSLIALQLTACATAPKPPNVAKISFVSMEKGAVTETISDGNWSEAYEVPGYKIQFESNREIAHKLFPEGGFYGVDLYECDSPARYPSNHTYKMKNYVALGSSSTTLLKRNTNGSVLYEAELIEANLLGISSSICAQIFVPDGKANRKFWWPVLVSNKMELRFPEFS